MVLSGVKRREPVLEVPAVLVGTSGPRPRVYLHAGASKTGTTFLQEVLWLNRDTLRRSGTLYPGLSPDAHFRAATDLCGADFQEHADPLAAGAWQRLVDQARAWGGSVVLSHELLSMADGQVARRALRDLSFAEVHLVCTVRDLARQIPASWQEDVKNRQVLTFTEYLAQLRAVPHRPAHYLAELFWRLQDTPAMLRTWTGAGVPAERVHLVTVPPRGASPEVLWQRFAPAVGVEPGGCETTLERPSNSSMGVAETNLLRRLNVELADNLDWPTYDVLVKDHLALYVLGARAGRPLRLPRSEQDWVSERSRLLVEALRTGGYRVTGDLDELLVPSSADRPDQAGDRTSGADHPDDVDDAEMLDAAVHAMVGLLHWARDNRRSDVPGWRRTAIMLSARNSGIKRLHHGYLTAKARLADQRRARR